jgi:hypothetical protein
VTGFNGGKRFQRTRQRVVNAQTHGWFLLANSRDISIPAKASLVQNA